MKTVTKFCLKMVQNYLPDAFILAILFNICCILRRNVFNEQECSANDRILGQRVLIDVCFWDADGFSFIDRLCTGIDTFG